MAATTASKSTTKKKASSKSSAAFSWAVYHALCLIRISVLPCLTGYIHPDEFFQGGQELWFGCPPNVPWEFEPTNAVRSIVPPTLMTYWPLQAWAVFEGVPMSQLNGWIILVIPRVFCAILSIFVVDFSVWSLCPRTKGVPLPVMLLSMAWPVVILLGRPFSNSMETFVLALLLRTMFQNKGKLSVFTCLWFGAFCALGIFTRFTFVAFAAPVVAFFLYKAVRTGGLMGWGVYPLVALTSFLLVANYIVDLDSDYYATVSTADVVSQHRQITPWNAFQYNSQTENLAQHGLHPYWTHVAVNMLMLFGPMAIVAYIALFRSSQWFGQGTSTSSDDKDGSQGRSELIVVCKGIVVVGLALLSTAPHQEPRFLLPLIIPLVLLSDNPWTRSPPQFLVNGWVLFNVVLIAFFGLSHQAGVIESLMVLGTELVSGPQPEAVLYYHTYMPPSFLSRTGSAEGSCKQIPIVELDGTQDVDSLRQSIRDLLPCTEENPSTTLQLATSPWQRSFEGELWYMGSHGCLVPDYECQVAWQHGPHITTEDFPGLPTLNREGPTFSLYELKCKAKPQAESNGTQQEED